MNWGTAQQPGPTLNLVEFKEAACDGTAFEFPAAKEEAVIAYLAKREGRDFKLSAQPATLDDGSHASVLVPLYTGKNVIDATTDELAAMAMVAKGKSGMCVSYIDGIKQKLDQMQVRDPAVDNHVQCAEPHQKQIKHLAPHNHSYVKHVSAAEPGG